MLILVTGGSGSGKSEYAENTAVRLAKEEGLPLYYIAAMKPYGEEGRRRVERHRRLRAGKGFETWERYVDLKGLALPKRGVALLECLSNLTANEMFEPGGDFERIRPALESWMETCAHLLIVTNDVFSDGVRYDALTMEYMRRLAELNAWIAARADSVTELVFSLPVAIKGALPCA